VDQRAAARTAAVKFAPRHARTPGRALRGVIIGTGKSSSPRGGPGKKDRNESITVAKIALMGTLLAALITAAATVFPVLLRDDPPNAGAIPPPGIARGSDVPPGRLSAPMTPGGDGGMSASSDGAQVEFLSPQKGASISPGDSVAVAGTVTGLGKNTLWILAWHEDGGSFFMVSGESGVSPVATKDGPWSVTDEGVGTPSDKGRIISYTAVLAGAECTKALAAKRDDDSFHALPPGCINFSDHRDVQVM
jgi:hypothetical protein